MISRTRLIVALSTVAVLVTVVGAVKVVVSRSDKPSSRAPSSVELAGGQTQTAHSPGEGASGKVVGGSTSAARTDSGGGLKPNPNSSTSDAYRQALAQIEAKKVEVTVTLNPSCARVSDTVIATVQTAPGAWVLLVPHYSDGKAYGSAYEGDMPESGSLEWSWTVPKEAPLGEGVLRVGVVDRATDRYGSANVKFRIVALSQECVL